MKVSNLKKTNDLNNIGCAVIVKNDQEQILLGKRKNIYGSGLYGLPGGRVKKAEKALFASKRELQEETGLNASNLIYVGVVKEWQDSYNFIHFIYLCTKWHGDLELMEPDRCEDWQWFNLNNLPRNILPGHLQAIKLLQDEVGIADI